MKVFDRHDHYVGEVRNGYVYNSSDKYVGKVSVNGTVEDSNGKYAGTVYHDGSIRGSISGGYIYAEGSVNDRNDRPAGKVSGIGTFSNAQDRCFAGGAALLLLLQSTASRATTPTSGSKEVFSTQGGRTVWKYTVKNAAEKMGTEEGIVRLKEWAVVHDLGVVFPRASWEIWVAGELQDTRFSESDAVKELRKYLSGEYTYSLPPSSPVRTAPPRPVTKHVQQKNRKAGIGVGVVVLLVILAILILVLKNTLQPPIHLTLNNSSHGSATFDVQATQDWQDSGVFISQGTTITIQYVSGSWRPWPGADFDGNGCTQGCDPVTHNLIVGCNHGGLIGRIGSSDMICILNSKTVTAAESGELYFRINDDKQDDDSGDITVQISSQ